MNNKISKILIYKYLLFFVYLLLWSCQEDKTKLPKQKSIKIDSKQTELAHLKSIAEKQLLQSLPYIINNHYEGEHWLATFALKALMSK